MGSTSFRGHASGPGKAYQNLDDKSLSESRDFYKQRMLYTDKELRLRQRYVPRYPQKRRVRDALAAQRAQSFAPAPLRDALPTKKMACATARAQSA